jgi:alpha-2-macroglobulin
MKTYPFALTAFLAISLAASAAPRLVVSTPSLNPESKIDLVLDSPAIATADLGKMTENTWLQIDPPIPGKLLWKAQNIVEFRADQPPVIGTRYTFSIPKGHQHLDHSPVPDGKITTLESEPFQIQSTTCQNRWAADYSPSTTQWTISFNDEVDPAAAAAFISFSSDSGLRIAAKLERATIATAGTYASHYPTWHQRWTKQNTSENPPAMTPESLVPNVILATPVSPLPVAKHWVISTLKGLPNASGSAKLLEDQSSDIGAVEPFKIASIEAFVAPDQPRQIVLNFNQHPSEQLPEDFLTSCLDISPRPNNLSARIDEKSIWLSGDFYGAAKYNITVKPPLTSQLGFPLAGPFSKELTFEYIEPMLALPSENQAQLAAGSRTYKIQTVNLSHIRVRIKKLADTNLIRAYQGYNNYTGAGHNGEAIQPTAPVPYAMVTGETLLDKEIPIDCPVDGSKEITLRWDELLPKDLHHATLFLDVIGTSHPGTGNTTHRNSQALVQLTDIGLAWKLTKNEALLYAFSCKSGTPLSGVKVAIFGDDASLIQSATTDALGLVSLPRPDAARHLNASIGSDSYVTAFDATLSTVGLWHFPIRYSWNQSTQPVRKAFLFTDRSLYRPGEIVRLKGILRTQDGNAVQPASHGPARVAVMDPTDKEIFTSPVTLSANGSFDLTYKLPADKTGTHSIVLEFPEELEKARSAEAAEDYELLETLTQNARFQLPLPVEEFRRNAFEIKQTIAAPAPAATEITADLTASYYQGQPVAGGKVKYFSRIHSQNPYPERFRDFLFGNHRVEDWTYWYHYFGYRSDEESVRPPASQIQGEATLSADGKANLSIAIPQSEFPTTREVYVSSEVTDANNQTLTSTSTTTVHPSSVYVGVSRNDQLIRAGEAVPFRLVAADTEGEPFKGAVKVTATLTREVNSTVKSRTDTGATTSRNDMIEETIMTSEVTINPADSAKEGTTLTLTPKASGRHLLTLRGTDPEGRPFATVTYFYAYGTNEYPWMYEDGLRVKLVAEKKSYQAGETAKILVLTPIEGTAWVTVEREKILRSFQVPLHADKPVIEIPLTADDAPNAFVSVLIVKGAQESAREHKEPQLRLGYCELIVENQRDRLDVTLRATPSDAAPLPVSTEEAKVDPSFQPGDEITLTGSIKLPNGSPAANAEVTVYAEDEGTLAVMGYETPKPMDYFYAPRTLDVKTGTSFETFIPESPDEQYFSNKGFFIGGGGDFSKLMDRLRKNFDPCGTWAPALITDASGNFTHTFKVPDTLTRYRLIAIAHHGAVRFGHTESAFVVKKDLMLEPKAPRFANQSDRFDTQVLVQNASALTGTWQIDFTTQTGPETPCVKSLGETSQTITLDSGASTTLVFPAIAENTGEAVLIWKATPVSLKNAELTPLLTRRLSDAVETRFQVNYPMPLLHQVELANLKTPGKAYALTDMINRHLLDGTGSVSLEFSRSPLIEAGGSIDYLLSYPYGCIEQTSSSLIPWLTVDTLRPFVPAFEKIPAAKVATAIQAGADRLLSMQLPDGSFAYWPGSKEPVPWASAYAGMVLMMASENGANVPSTAIDLLKTNLIESLRGMAAEKSPAVLETHARALLVLALAGAPQPAYQNLMADRLPELLPGTRALLATAISKADPENPRNLAQAKSILTSNVKFKLKDDTWMPWSAEEAYDLMAWIAADPSGAKATEALDKLLRQRNPYGHWRTTWVNGWSLVAMADYAKTQDANHESVSISLDSSVGKELINLTTESPTALRSFKLTPNLKLDLTPNHSTFVRLNVASKPAIAPVQPVASNGLSIDRIYQKITPDGSSEILAEPKVGDLIRVSLRVTLPSDDTRYLVIDDPLPSIFETVNSDFSSQSAAAGLHTSESDWNVSHTELRTDRATFFLDHVWRRGTYTVSYLARCTIAGKATAPSAKVEPMYSPEKFALSASRLFTAE